MSVESKIKELLESKKAQKQLSEESTQDLAAAGVADTGAKASANAKKDSSKAAAVANAGDTTQPMQGSSQKATFTTTDEDDENQGAKAAAPVSKDTTLPTSKGDAKSAKTPAMEEVATEEQETISEVDLKTELASIFGEDISEEFKSKATSIFEAAVIARVNSEMEKVVEKLEEQTAEQLIEYKETLVEKVDSYLNYVVKQWMEENQLAIDHGLRNEITEEFMSGLQKLFKENYIEIPEEKYNVIDDMDSKITTLESELSKAIDENVTIIKEYTELKKQIIFEESTKDLASTEVEKLKKLIEGVEYESDDLYKEKLSVIKENYFPKVAKTSPEKTLIEETGTGKPFDTSDVMSKYVEAISRAKKNR